MKAEIDGAQIHSQADLHKTLARTLDFGPYYGANLSALWDRLTTDVERPVEVIWHNTEASRDHMGEEQFTQIRDLLQAVAEQDETHEQSNRFTVRFL
ncbi:barstar family protein [Streptomyces sp. WAC08241]|uniref:barstar family protein n=1 Tax=Streptomyces sp. WAC08241 TaxID=2487421 RepID=UPI000F7A6409|nr:barstar family protein [Streptomyces sp. WAC08241]RSS37115.1 barnase inhibitor [Streptomyces sp. WAC08241]